MKITVFGAGAVGGHIAARLAKSGTAVSVIARGEHLRAIRRDGLILELGDTTHACRVAATDNAAEFGAQDLVIVSVKGHGLAAAAPGIRPLIGAQTRVLFAMNGLPGWFADGLALPEAVGASLDPQGVFAGIVPPERAIWCVVTSGAAIVRPGVVRTSTPAINTLVLGYPDDRRDDVLARVAELLTAAGYTTTISPNIRAAIWLKMLFTASQAMIAAVVERNGIQLMSDPETRAIVVACMREIIAIGEAIGVRVEADPVAMTDPSRYGTHRSSFLQDMEAGRPLELSNTILAVRDIARAIKVPAPHLDTVAALVAARSADRSGKRK